MSEKVTGGPAFPSHELHIVMRQSGYRDEWLAVGGMTRRDYLAGQALAGLCAALGPEYSLSRVADDAVSLADALLAALEAK